jgi:hypothetical protein
MLSAIAVVFIHIKAILAALEDVKTESTTTEARTKANAFIHLMERSTFIVILRKGVGNINVTFHFLVIGIAN